MGGVFVSGGMMDWIGVGLCMAAGFFWAGCGVAAQHFFQHSAVSAMELTAFRMLCAAGLFALMGRHGGGWHRCGEALRRWPRLWLSVAFYGLAGLMAMHFTYFEAIAEGNAAAATVIQYTCPAMVIGWLAFRRRQWPRRGDAAAVVLALAGTVLLVTGGRLDVLAVPAACAVWALLSAVFFAVSAAFPKPLLKVLPECCLLALGMAIGAAAAWALDAPEDLKAFFAPEVLFDTAAIILGGTVLSFFCYNAGLARLSPEQASLTATIEPVVSVVMCHFLFGTEFSLPALAGIGLVLGGIVMPALWREETAGAAKEEAGRSDL